MDYARSILEKTKKVNTSGQDDKKSDTTSIEDQSDSNKKIGFLRYIAESDASNFSSEQNYKFSEQKNDNEKILILELQVKNQTSIAFLQKKNLTNKWELRLYSEELLQERESTALCNLFGEIEEKAKATKITLRKYLRESCKQEDSLILRLSRLVEEVGERGFTKQSEREEMFNDEFMQSRFMQNDHLEEDFSVDLTNDLHNQITSHGNVLHSEVQELLEKKKELEVMIDELKKREGDLVKRFTTENFVKEYEKRIKELKLENEMLKLELEKYQSSMVYNKSTDVSTAGNSFSQEKDQSYTEKAAFGVVRVSYFKDFKNRFKLNTKIGWTNKNVYALKYSQSLSEYHGKGQFFSISLKMLQDWEFNFFINKSQESLGAINYLKNFKNRAKSKVLDLYYGDNFCAAFTEGDWETKPAVLAVYPGHRHNLIKLKAIPQTTFYLDHSGKRKENISSGIAFANSNQDLFFISVDYSVMSATMTANFFKKNPAFSEQMFLPPFSLNNPPQMMSLYQDILYLAMFDGSVISYDSKTGRQLAINKENSDLITMIHISHNIIVLGTVGVNKHGQSYVAVHAMRTEKFLNMCTYIHGSYSSRFKDCKIIKTPIKGQERTILVLVPEANGGALSFFEYSEFELNHITDKEEWWPKRQINGLCLVENKLFIYGENTESDEGRADLNTIACLSFT